MRSLIILISLFISTAINAQVTSEWTRRYNGSANSYDLPARILTDNTGDVIVAGSSNRTGSLLDFFIVKYSPEGNIIWDKHLNGSGNSSDQINDACLDKSGNIIVTGSITGNDLQSNIAVVKFDNDGDLLWERIFTTPKHTTGVGFSTDIDASGNAVVCGSLKDQNGYFDIAVLKYSPTGNLRWSRIYKGSGNGDDTPVGIKADVNGNIIVAGSAKTDSSGIDLLVLKYNTNGDLQWEKLISGTAGFDDRAVSLITDQSSNIIVAGKLHNTDTYIDWYYAKLNTNGNILWSHTYNGKGNSIDIPFSITTDDNSNILLTGYTRTDSLLGSEDILTMKINSFGTVIWSKFYDGGNGADQGNTIETDLYGNVYVGGASDEGGFHMEYVLIKYDASGNFKWLQKYSYNEHPEDFVYDITLGKDNSVYITGISFGPPNDFDVATIKYSQSVGIDEISNSLPVEFKLSQNFPNPFNPSTEIRFELASSAFVSIKVHDINGKQLGAIYDRFTSAGRHSVRFNANDLTSGVYYYSLYLNGYLFVTKKMILQK